ncbi:MAG: GspE/PulE family protein [bacterium]|nr:GspE/PulE family protein [bacterium]
MADNPPIPSKVLAGQHIATEVLGLVPADAATHYQFVPVGVNDGVLEVGMVNPDDLAARDALQFIASKIDLPFKVFQISAEDFAETVKGYEGLTGEVDKALGEFEASVEADKQTADDKKIKFDKRSSSGGPSIIEEAPVTKIVQVVLEHATSGNASDIHIEPLADKVRVRFRVDGTLFSSIFLPLSVHQAVVARIKILTNMKLDEKRKPQDGRFSVKLEGRRIDFRVSTLPTYFGEKVVIRILDPEKKLIDLPSLGLTGENLALVKNILTKPYGLVLLTGPTGSGKTTTLYSMLNEIDREKFNVVSLEDPIEYDIPGVNQSQVQPDIDYTFANGLRSILRQDPDIIMVGEIRDKETAKLAIQAALTGHLVLSTLHTNNAMGVIPRLIDMGVDPYLIAPTLVAAMAQRLVPTLCADSKEELPISDSIKAMIDKQFSDLPAAARDKIKIPTKVYQGVKSATCPAGTGGRIGVFEIIEMDQGLERIILTKPTEVAIYDYVRAKGFLSFKEDALEKAFAGLIPFAEVNKL